MDKTIFDVEWESVTVLLNVGGDSRCLGGFVMDNASILFQLDAGEDEIAFRAMGRLVDFNDARSLVTGGIGSAMNQLTVLDGVVVESGDVGCARVFALHVSSISEDASIGTAVKLGTSTACLGQATDSASGNHCVVAWWLPLLI